MIIGKPIALGNILNANGKFPHGVAGSGLKWPLRSRGQIIAKVGYPHKQREMRSYKIQFLNAPLVAPDEGSYAYAETNYANPHALTGYFNGSATTTYAYDANGNLLTLTGGATSTFMWDYRNRMISAWVSGATSTYQYDHTVQRMR